MRIVTLGQALPCPPGTTDPSCAATPQSAIGYSSANVASTTIREIDGNLYSVDLDANGNPVGIAAMDPVTGSLSTPPPSIVQKVFAQPITVPASPAAQAAASQIIPGVSNTLLLIAAGILGFALIAGGRR